MKNIFPIVYNFTHDEDLHVPGEQFLLPDYIIRIPLNLASMIDAWIHEFTECSIIDADRSIDDIPFSTTQIPIMVIDTKTRLIYNTTVAHYLASLVTIQAVRAKGMPQIIQPEEDRIQLYYTNNRVKTK